MNKSDEKTFLKKLSDVLSIVVLLVILIPLAFFGYQMVKGVFFPSVDKSAVARVNQETGEKEYLALDRFYRIQGTSLLVAGLNARTGVRDFYYSGGYGAKIRNYLFYDVGTGKSRWLLPTHSSLFSQSHQLLKNPDVRKQGVEYGSGWESNQPFFKDPSTEVVSVIYEAVLSDTNNDGRLENEDKKSVLFVNLTVEKVITILENVDDVLGIEQKSVDETLIFYTKNQKNFVFTINSTTGKAGDEIELAAIG